MHVWKSVVAILNISHVFFEMQSHLFEAMYHADCRTTGRSQIVWLVVWCLKNMRDSLHFICLPLPTIKRQVTFFMLLLLSPFEQHLILNVLITASFGLLNGFLYVLYKLIVSVLLKIVEIWPPSPHPLPWEHLI